MSEEVNPVKAIKEILLEGITDPKRRVEMMELTVLIVRSGRLFSLEEIRELKENPEKVERLLLQNSWI